MSCNASKVIGVFVIFAIFAAIASIGLNPIFIMPLDIKRPWYENRL